MGLFNKTPAEKEEKILHKEAKHDDSAVKHALKDVASAEKAEHHTAKEHTAAIKAHAKAVETEHKLAAKLNQLQHEHEAALSREQKLAKDIQLKDQHHLEAEQTIAAKKKALEQVQHKHDINNATRSEKLHQLESVGSHPTGTTGTTGMAPGTTGYGNEPVGTGVGGGPGYTTAAPAAR
ncbi:hypothetical protein HD553DRAFT_136099 [Filobasidium floriforme]|uniref:uncharacterized protein n=1 Tax=Filobasidium floriforme TaxID=5210 RepID=UPI001E8CE508|nr:uncharacterized protein HD553DRAFT_136099 [Filobasidium floriforme]KAH8078882.1 hypothetical protein HD553DRAFT_136099 [Filobasidium floriforme]